MEQGAAGRALALLAATSALPAASTRQPTHHLICRIPHARSYVSIQSSSIPQEPLEFTRIFKSYAG